MNSLFKSKHAFDSNASKKTAFKTTIALAIGMAGVVMTLTTASAATNVRDHRDKPVVRDHREGQPEVRDHRSAGGGGVTVRDTPPKRKPVDCLGNLCHVKKVCIGFACI
ncbi:MULTISPECIES: hypothetical protein [Bradyrhizobium]|jgi:hypothetical protein|uniref:hypothetical protein n=1 Tax=Bradyrhizobium TaxID=374 RepID=UPI001BAD0898|nr:MULTISPECIES: hypothetical protein [Bradyrhizobium]MBR0814133.1 hypothetical protein [Bradyrhizobium diazoefficiens]WOH72574.1 hypothetical protein RX330_30540 [Bradyrhizobium sp. NDS-1]